MKLLVIVYITTVVLEGIMFSSTSFSQLSSLYTDPPGAPGDINVTEVGGDFVSLTWDKPLSDGGGRIAGYYIEKKDANSTNWTRVNMVSSVLFLAMELIEKKNIDTVSN